MYKWVKRILDILISLIALPFVIIAFIFLAPIIFLTDRGPVFYIAERRGKYGKVFKMYKFRSMYVNSPDLRNADGSTFNSSNDTRVTPIGKIMRKTSLDELPQFLNVLVGDMSIVGPRPTLATKEFSMDTVSEDRKKHFLVAPGITGYCQAYFRNSITQDEKFKNDAYYVDNISFLFDVKILFKTFTSVLAHKNVFVSTETAPAVSSVSDNAEEKIPVTADSEVK